MIAGDDDLPVGLDGEGEQGVDVHADLGTRDPAVAERTVGRPLGRKPRDGEPLLAAEDRDSAKQDAVVGLQGECGRLGVVAHRQHDAPTVAIAGVERTGLLRATAGATSSANVIAASAMARTANLLQRPAPLGLPGSAAWIALRGRGVSPERSASNSASGEKACTSSETRIRGPTTVSGLTLAAGRSPA